MNGIKLNNFQKYRIGQCVYGVFIEFRTPEIISLKVESIIENKDGKFCVLETHPLRSSLAGVYSTFQKAKSKCLKLQKQRIDNEKREFYRLKKLKKSNQPK